MLYRICFLFYCCLVFGCGDSRPYSVQAFVTLDDKPLAEAAVSLISVQDNVKPAFGITNEDGQVVFKMEEVDGVLPSTYIVTISKMDEEKVLSNNQIRALAEVGVRYRPKITELVPEKYTRRETSDLRVKVGYWSSKKLTFNLRSDRP